ncbi:ABC transporter substrate-binding protein [Rhizobacter sp. Root1221]|uniref:ABC transporter substrate-binding protein n=1 Tax=Rhizobacter sp. Root1221 TaxID=1736433 RepID=UPI0006F32010|nr:ABC transporter substrate-binding protein [Rhizobacter sp. Root1221]KQW00223.1 amino acid-binding protein [Rhizobacter sp. Root1221]
MNHPLISVSRRWALGLCVAAALPAWASGEPIVIGQVAPMTGPQGVTGRAMNAGAKLYFDSINAKGGVRGRPITLVTRDDAQNPVETVRLTKELIASSAPVAMISTVGTANLEALVKDGILAQRKVSMVGAVSGAASVAQADGMHVVKASYHDEVARLFTQLNQLGIKNVGLVYQDDGLGKDVLKGAEEAARKTGIELTAKTAYARNTIAVETSVSDMLKAKPQVVLLGATTAAAVEFVKQYNTAGGTATLYGMSIIDTEALLKALGPKGARGYAFSVVLPLAQETNRPVVREYLALRQASKDPNLSARSIEGYIAAKALVKALEGISNPTAATVTSALDSARSIDVGGYVLDFTQKNRTGSQYVDFAMFGADGKIVH